MAIEREEVDAGRVEFGEVVTGKRVPAVHPGEILRHDFLEAMGLSVYALARALKVPRTGKPFTAKRYFGSAQRESTLPGHRG